MSLNLDRYRELKAKVETHQREADRAAGALQATMERIQKEFNCKSLAEAEAKKKELEITHQRLLTKFDLKLLTLQKKWKARLP